MAGITRSISKKTAKLFNKTEPITASTAGATHAEVDETLSEGSSDDLQVRIDSKKALLKFTSDIFSVVGCDASASQASLSTALRHVLNAQLTGELITISTLAKKNKRLVLVKIEARVSEPSEENITRANEWIRRFMKAAYPDSRPRRNFKIIVNPAGGPGKASIIFEKRVRPIFEAAGCLMNITYTTHSGHAREIAMTLHLQFDAIVTVSGDGVVNEVVNGFAKRLDALTAFRTVAIVPIPAGSGNGFSLNLLGLEDGFDAAIAALNAIKGKAMPIDLASVTLMESRETIYSVLSQSGGLMAELDLGTENLRWMGDKRFILGFLRGLFSNVGRPLKVTVKTTQSDKAQMLEAFLRDSPITSESKGASGGASSSLSHSMPLPEFIDESDAGEGWTEFDKPILYIYGGLMPIVGRDLMDFPMKRPGDGSIDLVVQEIETRATMVNMIENAGKGDPFFLHSHHYYKAQAYRVAPIPSKTPTKTKGYFSIDGEAFPYQAFHVEAHREVMTTFSMYGKYMIGDFGKQGKTFSKPRS